MSVLPDPPQRDVLADELVGLLRPRVPQLVAALDAQLRSDVPAAMAWTAGQRDRTREALRDLVEGFLRYLRIGDLEATDCERLRELGATPLPGVPQSGTSELVRTLRSTFLVAAVDLLPTLDGDRERLLRVELEGYIALIARPESRIGDVGALDPWLARIAAAPRDVDADDRDATVA